QQMNILLFFCLFYNQYSTEQKSNKPWTLPLSLRLSWLKQSVTTTTVISVLLSYVSPCIATVNRGSAMKTLSFHRPSKSLVKHIEINHKRYSMYRGKPLQNILKNQYHPKSDLT
ncbi:MAG: hypothetical protein ABW185_16375, partial [Sedimenticola sp.]